jgi:hypothetical protein
VKQGRVLYIVGEGVNGIDKRLAAWEQAHGAVIGDDALLTVNGAVQIADSGQLAELLEVVESDDFALVVVDTVARSAVGLDENSAKDMGVFIDAAEQIKQATGSGTVLLVHHTGKDKTTVRGSSALEAAMDTVYTTEGDPLNLRLKRTKRKDGPMEDTFQLRLVPTVESAVLEPMDAAVHRKASDNDLESRSWVALGCVFGDRVFTKTEAVTVLTDEEQAGLSRASAYRVITRLGLAGVLRNVAEGTRSPQFLLDRDAAKKIGLPAAAPFRLPTGSGDGFLPVSD